MKFSTLSLVFVLLFSTSCSLFVDEYQVNSRKVIAYLLEDLPLPDDADIIKLPTVLLGTGDAISGRITLESGYSPAENLIFYGNETLTTGWQLVDSLQETLVAILSFLSCILMLYRIKILTTILIIVIYQKFLNTF